MRILRQSCERAIVSNFVGAGPWIAAGGHQFGSLWTRDFCFSVKGLLSTGSPELRRIALTQLREILRWVKSDGDCPRLLDDGSASWRVIKYTIFHRLTWHQPRPLAGALLRPQYLGEHRTPARDSGPLILLALIRNFPFEDIQELSPLERKSLFALIRRELIDSGNLDRWITQPAYSDWQDSKQRVGATHYLNTISLWALDRASQESIAPLWREEEDRSVAPIASIHARTKARARLLWPDAASVPSEFLDRPDHLRASVDGALLWLEAAAECGWFPRADLERRYQALRCHPLWTRDPIPGRVSDRPSTRAETAWTTRLVGLGQYHGDLWWWWLAALSARVAQMYGEVEEARRILNELEGQIREAGREPFEIGVWAESASRPEPVQTLLYRAEQPFTWAAAQTLESLALFEPVPDER